MRQGVMPLVAPAPKHRNGDGCHETEVRGLAVLNSPLSKEIPINDLTVGLAIEQFTCVAQVNNAMLYPGPVPGAIVSRAGRISDGRFGAAANAASSLATVRQRGASLLPQIDDLRNVPDTVAVAGTADAEGLAGLESGDIVPQAQGAMWQPQVRRSQAS